MMDMVSLGHFFVKDKRCLPGADKGLSRLLYDITLAAKIVSRAINLAGMTDILGSAGGRNCHGESQQKLDLYANEQFISALRKGGECCMVVSEENEEVVMINTELPGKGKYIVSIDPLDGSSNIDANVPVGTIFSVTTRNSGGPGDLADVLQKGTGQVAAGYIIYGSSTMLVYTTGCGVNGFTLDTSIGEFCLSHPDIRIPCSGVIYSVNEGNYLRFPQWIKTYINHCRAEQEGGDRPYTSRYIGSMVADVHRNLIKGGIFLYPATTEAPGGKLRLLYECNPLAFIVEQAGGRATNGRSRILELEIHSLHQRSPILIGSTEMVLLAEHFLKEEDNILETTNPKQTA
jgi:fructose-1,6-bisphosphatase I